MSAMLEKAARALFERRYGDLEGRWLCRSLFGGVLTYDEVVAGVAEGRFLAFPLDELRAEVRTVLGAIREPDEATVRAAQSWEEPADYDMNRTRGDWRCMIDVLLAQGRGA